MMFNRLSLWRGDSHSFQPCLLVLKHTYFIRHRKSALWAVLWLIGLMVYVGMVPVVQAAPSLSQIAHGYQVYLQRLRPVLTELEPIRQRLNREPELMTRQHWNALVTQFHLTARYNAQQLDQYAQDGYQSARLVQATYQHIEELSAFLARDLNRLESTEGHRFWDAKVKDLSIHLNQLSAFSQLEQSITQTHRSSGSNRQYR